ncbi:phenylacetate-CoA ligase [Chishuiella changwenlii]|uniref:Phenylacetate-coenzyme A ligase n=1 Tax=Chishuiella changwenlii TaxID=1434701 RepID=A0A1M7CE22_9FLAO|nr:phenylacetate--CoA ligase [Chishuiella changwenlii]GGF06328.1 phenylacetate-coenzyme A ligase [Chishuiella changwenlii]SHL65515.1 phenylacetate-CoA ligase [Chishuiella changwenlii]
MLFNPDIEQLPIEKLRKVQNERLQKTLQKVYNKVPFYKEAFDKAGVKPEDIKGVEDLHKLPFTKKNHLRESYPFGLFAEDKSNVIRLHCSSGTTGKPTVVGYTRNDIELFSEVVARSLAASGCKPGMTLQNAYGYGLFTGGLGLHYGAEKLGMTVVPISGGNTEKQIMLLKDFQADTICATPSYALTVAEEIKKRGESLDNFNLKFAILGSEPWSEALRQEVETNLNIKASNIYGLSEIIGPGVSNEDFEEQGTGSYIWEDHFFPEIVDEKTGEPVPYGEPGVLVITTLTKEALPLIRYWTGDITTLTYEHSDKRTHVKMGPIIGRADDMMIIRGVNFFHTQIADFIPEFPQLSPNYQVVLTKPKNMDVVEVGFEINPNYFHEKGVSCDNLNVDANADIDRLISNIQKKIRDSIGLGMNIKLYQTDGLPKSEGGKLNRVIDNRLL